MEKLAFIVGIAVTLVVGPQQAAELINDYGNHASSSEPVIQHVEKP